MAVEVCWLILAMGVVFLMLDSFDNGDVGVGFGGIVGYGCGIDDFDGDGCGRGGGCDGGSGAGYDGMGGDIR